VFLLHVPLQVERGAEKDEWETFRESEMNAFFASVKEIRHKYLRLIEVSSPEVEKGYDQLIVATNKGQTAAAQVRVRHAERQLPTSLSKRA
jgi:hypothetical protein